MSLSQNCENAPFVRWRHFKLVPPWEMVQSGEEQGFSLD